MSREDEEYTKRNANVAQLAETEDGRTLTASDRTIELGNRGPSQSRVRKKSIFNNSRWTNQPQPNGPKEAESVHLKTPNRWFFQRHQSLDLKQPTNPNRTFEIESGADEIVALGENKRVFVKNHFRKKNRQNQGFSKIKGTSLKMDLARVLMGPVERKRAQTGKKLQMSKSRKSCFVKTSSYFFEKVGKYAQEQKKPTRSMAQNYEHCIWGGEAVQKTQSDLMEKLSEVESQENEGLGPGRLKMIG